MHSETHQRQLKLRLFTSSLYLLPMIISCSSLTLRALGSHSNHSTRRAVSLLWSAKAVWLTARLYVNTMILSVDSETYLVDTVCKTRDVSAIFVNHYHHPPPKQITRMTSCNRMCCVHVPDCTLFHMLSRICQF